MDYYHVWKKRLKRYCKKGGGLCIVVCMLLCFALDPQWNGKGQEKDVEAMKGFRIIRNKLYLHVQDQAIIEKTIGTISKFWRFICRSRSSCCWKSTFLCMVEYLWGKHSWITSLSYQISKSSYGRLTLWVQSIGSNFILFTTSAVINWQMISSLTWDLVFVSVHYN